MPVIKIRIWAQEELEEAVEKHVSADTSLTDDLEREALANLLEDSAQKFLERGHVTLELDTYANTMKVLEAK